MLSAYGAGMLFVGFYNPEIEVWDANMGEYLFTLQRKPSDEPIFSIMYAEGMLFTMEGEPKELSKISVWDESKGVAYLRGT